MREKLVKRTNFTINNYGSIELVSYHKSFINKLANIFFR